MQLCIQILRQTITTVSLAALAAQTAHAATPLGKHLTISGFGTAAGAVTSNDEDVFVREGADKGATRNASWRVDSKLGLQLDAQAGPFSATAQLLSSQRRSRNGFVTEVEWAYLTYNATEDFSIRLGRTTPAVFMVSDSRNVGYANTMLRMPNEVYTHNFLDRIEGAEASYRAAFGSYTLQASVALGTGRVGVPQTALEARRVRGINVTLDTTIGSFRIGRYRADVIDPEINAAIGQDLRIPYEFTGVGYQLEGEHVRLSAEYVRRRLSLLPPLNGAGWYAMAGYRVGAFTPYIAAARSQSEYGAVVFRFTGNQRTATAGLRWDPMPDVAVKFQLERIDPKGTVGASFSPSQPGPGRKTTAAGIGLDFIF